MRAKPDEQGGDFSQESAAIVGGTPPRQVAVRIVVDRHESARISSARAEAVDRLDDRRA